ncbi:MAG: DUF2147 domain-containing protein [Burkholderiales bacterium]|nr:DUF2147 domain-containing protein [Burkholderiales bacterium]
MKTLHLLAAGAIALATLPARAQTAPSPQGTWLTESGNLEVSVAPCGAALCGTVTRVLANRSMSAPGTELAADVKPALGMTILTGFEPSGEGEWKGQVYNRENGKTYSALMSLPAEGQMAIRGYVGLPLFGQTQVWRRVQK